MDKTEINALVKELEELHVQAYYEYVPLVIKYCGILDFNIKTIKLFKNLIVL